MYIIHTSLPREAKDTDFVITKIEVSLLAPLITVKEWGSYFSSIHFIISFLEMRRRIPSRESCSEEKREKV